MDQRSAASTADKPATRTSARKADLTPSEPSQGQAGRQPAAAPEETEDRQGRQLPAGLYVVATPIGNLRDITLRALDILRGAGSIACEDTRLSRRLLDAHAITGKTLLSYHEHNGERRRPEILARIAGGEAVALISDAGTPLVSDPGYKLVRAVQDAGLRVTALPGPSAVLTALCVAGLPSDRFFFQGFLPSKTKARRDLLQGLAAIPATLVIYESPHRLPASLADMAEVLGAREASVTRELTKRFEEVRRASLPDLAAHYAEAGQPKGEIVVVIAPPQDTSEAETAAAEADLDRLLAQALAESGSLRDAVEAVTRDSGLKRKAVYARALELAKEAEG